MAISSICKCTLYSVLIFVYSHHTTQAHQTSVSQIMRFSFIVFHVFSFVVENSKGAVPSLILDTDMDFDVDDVGALCLVHSLQVVHLLYFTF